jgi:hypothetical protein
MQEPQLDHVLQRLHRVERAQRWWQVGGLMAVAVLGLVVVLGAAGHREVIRAEEVRAQRFVLVDDDDKPRAIWHISEKGTSLFLFDEARIPRVGLSVGQDGIAGLAVHDRARRLRLVLITYADGRSQLGLLDDGERPRVIVDLDRDGIATLKMMEQEGTVRWSAP